MTGAYRIVQRNLLVYRRVWRGTIFFSFLQPTLFLVAMGVGLGRMIDRAAVLPGGAALPGGVPFLHFLAPGLLAAACMQTGASDSSYPITGKMTWRRIYEAITATPIDVANLVVGELCWVGLRLLTVATAFMLVMIAFGVRLSPLAPLAIPAGMLTGLAFAAPIMAFAGTLKNGGNFNMVFRFVITPLFMFSGVFFPISRLPEPLQRVAWATPLFHGVELVRGLALGGVQAIPAVAHVAYLVTVVAVGTFAAVRIFTRKLRP
jgi:lipooligosaccharide transport system permease protein